MCFPTDVSPRIISYIHNSETMYTYQNQKKNGYDREAVALVARCPPIEDK